MPDVVIMYAPALWYMETVMDFVWQVLNSLIEDKR